MLLLADAVKLLLRVGVRRPGGTGLRLTRSAFLNLEFPCVPLLRTLLATSRGLLGPNKNVPQRAPSVF
jgi:hypothetical protein